MQLDVWHTSEVVIEAKLDDEDVEVFVARLLLKLHPEITGGSISRMTTATRHVALFPLLSLAVMVTLKRPTWKNRFALSVETTLGAAEDRNSYRMLMGRVRSSGSRA